MDRLTEKKHWNVQYQDLRETSPDQRPVRSPFKRFLLGLTGNWLREYSRPYHRYLYFQVLLGRHWPREKDLKLIELGSAPGKLLVQLSGMYGYEPYGVDFSDDGVAMNRQVFAESGISPDNVLQADFLGDEFLDEYRDHFDIVWSHSTVEHFANPRQLVDAHLDILKPGGSLVIYIPNLRGINEKVFNFFDRDFRDRHNLDLMQKDAFRACFDPERVEELHCDYIGTYYFGMFNTPPGSRKRPLLRLCKQFQKFLNVMFRIVFRDRGWEHSWHSPGLIFVGKKR